MQGSACCVCVCVWTAVRRERSGAGYFSQTPQWHCGSFRHHMCKRYGSCIPPGLALLTVFSFLIRLRAFVHAAYSSSTSSSSSGANENLFFYMSTCPGWRSLSTGYGAERGKEKREDEKSRVEMRGILVQEETWEKPLFVPTLITHWL